MRESSQFADFDESAIPIQFSGCTAIEIGRVATAGAGILSCFPVEIFTFRCMYYYKERRYRLEGERDLYTKEKHKGKRLIAYIEGRRMCRESNRGAGPFRPLTRAFSYRKTYKARGTIWMERHVRFKAPDLREKLR